MIIVCKVANTVDKPRESNIAKNKTDQYTAPLPTFKIELYATDKHTHEVHLSKCFGIGNKSETGSIRGNIVDFTTKHVRHVTEERENGESGEN